MTNYLFQAEAVNLTPTVYDSSDISTIRGGGFYLLNRIHALAAELAGRYGKNCILIKEGASTAVFRIQTGAPDTVRKDIQEILYSDPDVIPEMMFLVEYIKSSESNFPEEMAMLQGRIRFSQMRSPSVRIRRDTLKPGTEKEGGYMAYDRVNRVLPAHQPTRIKGDISNFTHNRMEQGVKLRNSIYSHILQAERESLKDLEFTKSLEDLAGDSSKGNLNGKIAYIYIDGNKFGSLQKDLSEPDYEKFDLTIQNFKKDFLKALFDMGKSYRSFFNGREMRLETLLWGGDELKFIVPAWLGLKIAARFFETAYNLSISFADGSSKDLTFAMALILTYHKNPIQNIGHLAENLTDSLKAGITDPYNRHHGNRMHYLVLESLETLPCKYSDFIDKYYRTIPENLAMSPEKMTMLENFSKNLSKGFPRSRIHEISQAWLSDMRKGSNTDYSKTLQRGLDALEMQDSVTATLLQQIADLTGTSFKGGVVDKMEKPPEKGFIWLQVAELWDYITWEEK